LYPIFIAYSTLHSTAITWLQVWARPAIQLHHETTISRLLFKAIHALHFLYSVRVTHVISYTLWGWHTWFLILCEGDTRASFLILCEGDTRDSFLMLCEGDTRDFLYSVRMTHVISYTLWGWHTWFLILCEGDTRDLLYSMRVTHVISLLLYHLVM
jgi:hypothetical protein